MTTKDITLIVPDTFDLPNHLINASPDQLQHALYLADALLESGIHFNHDTQVKELRDKIKTLESTTVESVRAEAIRIAKAEYTSEIQGKNTLLSVLQKQLDDLKRNIEEIKSEKVSIGEKLSKKEQKIEELQEKLQQRIAVQSNSSKRGLEGEKDFEVITSNMKDWKLESVGKTKESADFHSIIQSLDVRFEVKNHETLVPYTKNVDKFERDMKEHPETKVGVFVALTARIEKFDGLTVRWTDDKQLLLFIPYFLSRDLTYTYELIEGYIRTMKHVIPYLEKKDTFKDVEMLTEKIVDSIKTIEALDKQIDSIQSDHKEYNTRMLSSYASLKSLVTSTLTSLTGKEQEQPKKKRSLKKSIQ